MNLLKFLTNTVTLQIEKYKRLLQVHLLLATWVAQSLTEDKG